MTNQPNVPTLRSKIELRRATQQLVDQLRGAEAIPIVRHRLIFSLEAVRKFIENLEPTQTWEAPFLQLQLALKDLDDGAVAPFLEPAKISTKHVKGSHEGQLRAHVIYYSDVLMETGMSLESAARHIASALQKHGISIGTARSHPWKVIKNWRNEHSRPTTSPPVVATVDGFRKDPPAPHLSSPEAAKGFVSEHLARTLKLIMLE